MHSRHAKQASYLLCMRPLEVREFGMKQTTIFERFEDWAHYPNSNEADSTMLESCLRIRLVVNLNSNLKEHGMRFLAKINACLM